MRDLSSNGPSFRGTLLFVDLTLDVAVASPSPGDETHPESLRRFDLYDCLGGTESTSVSSDDVQDYVTVSSEAELHGILSVDSESPTVVFLNTTRLRLTETVIIDSRRLILRGDPESETKIYCPPVRRSAFVLRWAKSRIRVHTSRHV